MTERQIKAMRAAVKVAMARAGMDTVRELADAIGMEPSGLRGWLNRGTGSIGTLDRVAEGLGTTAAALLAERDAIMQKEV